MHRPFPFSCKLIQALEENFKKQAITRAWLVFVLPIIHYDLASVLQTVIIGLTASFPCRKKYALYGDMTMFLDEVIGDNKLNYWPFLASHCIFCTFINCIHSHKLLISSWKLKETLKDYQVMLSVFSFSLFFFFFFFFFFFTYLLKWKVHPNMKLCWKCTRPQTIQDVNEFASWLEQIWRNVALHHLLNSRPSAVNGCRQNKSPNSWYKHQVIHMASDHQ